MKTNAELIAALNMSLARLESSEPRTTAEWEAISDALRTSYRYARKCAALRAHLDRRFHEAHEIATKEKENEP